MDGEYGRTRRLPNNTGDDACPGAKRASPPRAALASFSDLILRSPPSMSEAGVSKDGPGFGLILRDGRCAASSG
jgi:hypothetical protein